MKAEIKIRPSSGISLGVSMDEIDALGESTATAIAGGSNHCDFFEICVRRS